MKLKLRTIGHGTGLVLPKEILQRLHVRRDDSLLAIEIPGGHFLTRYDPEVEEQSRLGLDFMKQYRGIFRALAK
jgi:bifunctional DNA-binding transcriptional regulator/antitoxin component of YhaV-PrlF toxin-antitoxin module